jgi:hypothetical protein
MRSAKDDLERERLFLLVGDWLVLLLLLPAEVLPLFSLSLLRELDRERRFRDGSKEASVETLTGNRRDCLLIRRGEVSSGEDEGGGALLLSVGPVGEGPEAAAEGPGVRFVEEDVMDSDPGGDLELLRDWLETPLESLESLESLGSLESLEAVGGEMGEGEDCFSFADGSFVDADETLSDSSGLLMLLLLSCGGFEVISRRGTLRPLYAFVSTASICPETSRLGYNYQNSQSP